MSTHCCKCLLTLQYPHTAIYVSSYCNICVLMLLYMSVRRCGEGPESWHQISLHAEEAHAGYLLYMPPHTTIHKKKCKKKIQRHKSVAFYICVLRVLILQYLSSYYYIYVSSCYFICVLILVYICVLIHLYLHAAQRHEPVALPYPPTPASRAIYKRSL